VVLHSIRYLQSSFLDTSDADQRSTSGDYLAAYLPRHIADAWLDAFEAIEQLTAAGSQSTQNPRAA
jgi:hypothetical protein